jgi:transcriptional regulator with XRE-family HTH domain
VRVIIEDNALRRKIDKARVARSIKVPQLCSAMGVQQTTWYRWLSGKRPITESDLRRLEKVLAANLLDKKTKD